MNDEAATRILSPDFATASQALAEGIKGRDAGLVRLALDHPTLEIKHQAAEALGQFGDRSSVPRLIKALDQNQAIYRGGSETRVLQTELNGALITALQRITGVDFGGIDPSSEEEVRRVLEKSRHWLEKNPE
jgi:HEAT repeat protein